MLLATLREEVLGANLELVPRSLVLYTFGHAPLCWGSTTEAAQSAVIPQHSERMACHKLSIKDQSRPLTRELSSKRFLCTHGHNASYGQVNT